MQETSTGNRLSERLIVDLVDKIIREQDLKLFFSLDGQSYVTPQYLQQAIFQEIMVRGRLQIGSLVETLGVSYDKIEYVVEKNSWEVSGGVYLYPIT